jgi:hypothetical protein
MSLARRLFIYSARDAANESDCDFSKSALNTVIVFILFGIGIQQVKKLMCDFGAVNQLDSCHYRLCAEKNFNDGSNLTSVRQHDSSPALGVVRIGLLTNGIGKFWMCVFVVEHTLSILHFFSIPQHSFSDADVTKSSDSRNCFKYYYGQKLKAVVRLQPCKMGN